MDVDVHVISLRRPTGPLSKAQQETVSDVTYVLPAPLTMVAMANLRALVRSPAAYLGTAWSLLRGQHPGVARRVRSLLHFGLAVHVARLVEVIGPARVHAHFLDRATTVAMVISQLLDVPYSATAHANDIYVDPILLPEKINASDFVATCTGFNAAHLKTLGDPSKVELIHHGLDLTSYDLRSDGQHGPPLILAVGQLKEKKGFRYLIEACASLRQAGADFTCVIAGEGPLRDRLEHQISASGLNSTVRLVGALDHEDVIDHMRRATVFTLPSVVTPDGDRDGIPNVILEAMAVGVPVVSTRVSAIPEVVVDDVTGSLVEPADPHALAAALQRLLSDAELRSRYRDQARSEIEARFALEKNVLHLKDLFERDGLR